MIDFARKVMDAPLGVTHLFWVGQAGFIIKSKKGKLLGLDLYLSECVEPVEGHVGYHRLMPQILGYDELQFDVLIATHFHRDHFDIDAMPLLMANDKTQLYCAYDCKDDVERLSIDRIRTTFVRPGESHEIEGFKLNFIDSDHGKGAPEEVGIVVVVDDKRIYETGDTSLHLDWADTISAFGPLDVLIAPINGAYGNLNEQENVDLTAALKPKLTVPCHFGMFASHGGHPGLWKELLEQQLPQQQYKIFTMGEGITI